MDAKTLYALLKPHLDLMEPVERECLSQLIKGSSAKVFQRRRKILTLSGLKEKLKNFRNREIVREQKEIF